VPSAGTSPSACREENVFIVLNENDLPDWSFGNGIAQYMPGEPVAT
jgi:hypothetical protein